MIFRRVNRVSLVLIVLLCVTFALGAQPLQEQKVPTSEHTAIDALNRRVTVNGPLERILIAGRAAVMPADALFMFPLVANIEVILAKTDQGLGDFFPLLRQEYATKGRLGQQIGVEEILAYNPSLIITKRNNYDSVVKLLEPFNVPVFVMDLETSDAWKEEIVELGKLLGDEKTPQKIIKLFNQREAQVAQKIDSLKTEERPKTLVLQTALSDGVAAFSVAPNNWIQTFLVEKSGGNPVWLESNVTSNTWRKVSFEQIASWDPDEIILVNYSTPADEFIEAIRESPQWQQLKAAINGKIYTAPADLMSYFQADSRWILALQWLSAKLHPNLFSEVEIEAEIYSFYRDFYNIEDEQTLSLIVDAYRRRSNY